MNLEKVGFKLENNEIIALIVSISFLIMGYFVGNISPATLLAKKKNIEIRKEGSGNAGTTNVLRTLGKKAAVITLLVDIMKGIFVMEIGKLIFSYYYGGTALLHLHIMAGIAVFIGHIWPVIYKFKGGKGIATGFGVILMINPLIAVIALVEVIIVVIATRYVSLGAIIAALSLPLLSKYFQPEIIPWMLVMLIIVLYKHNQNISRLVKGSESKISFTK